MDHERPSLLLHMATPLHVHVPAPVPANANAHALRDTGGRDPDRWGMVRQRLRKLPQKPHEATTICRQL
jgi:hypothetical protein